MPATTAVQYCQVLGTAATAPMVPHQLPSNGGTVYIAGKVSRVHSKKMQVGSDTMLARAESMIEAKPTVFIVDDDPDIRESLRSLVRSVGLEVNAFGSVAEFLKAQRPDGPSCLILDVRLPERSGLDFQQDL